MSLSCSRTAVNDDVGRLLKEVVVAKCKVLSQSLPGGAAVNHEEYAMIACLQVRNRTRDVEVRVVCSERRFASSGV